MQLDSSDWLTHFIKNIFDITEEKFLEEAINLFHFQYKANDVYRKYCELIKCNPKMVKELKDIPFLPISLFKKHVIKTSPLLAEIVFKSSGTTTNYTSKHHVIDVSIYTESFIQGFKQFYGNIEDYHVLALLPSYLERKGSSLVYMVKELIQRSHSLKSNFFLHNVDELNDVLKHINQKKEKVLLIGVSFALVDFVDDYNAISNPNLIVMETGGMKGRKKEMIRKELHQILKEGFGIKSIHSEYGMTELLSQAYSKKNGRFNSPSWMKVLIRKQDDPFSYCDFEETGAINVIDFANVHSCPFIQTDDLGKLYSNGEFEVLGRFDQSDIRGCNLMVS